MIMDPVHQDLLADGFKFEEFFSSDSDSTNQAILLNQNPVFPPNSSSEEDYGFKIHEFFPSDSITSNSSMLQQPLDSFLNQNEFLRTDFCSSPPKSSPEEDSEVFTEVNLNYISQILLEDDIDEKVDTCHHEQSSALQSTEKPFYDILHDTHRTSPDQPPLDSCHSLEGSDDGRYGGTNTGSGSTSSGGTHNGWHYNSVEYLQRQVFPQPSRIVSSDHYSSESFFSSSNDALDYSYLPPFSSANSVSTVTETAEDRLSSGASLPRLFFASQSALQRGVEEAQKFIPNDDKLVIDWEATGFSLPPAPFEESRSGEVKVEKEAEGDNSFHGLRGRKHRLSEILDLEEGRSIKQSAVSFEDVVRSDMFDKVLLYNEDRCRNFAGALREAVQNQTVKSLGNGDSKGSSTGKARGKKQSKKEVVDFQTLLIHCAQAVAADDRRSATELLKQIRQHASPFGDGSQRLAHCFADGLEARLAGTGSQIYNSLVAKRSTASDVLKAYHLYLAACPFKELCYFLANQTVLNVAEKASRIHIVDFGIYFGFQWPILIQRLSSRRGGAPKLRITGIDTPQRGFRPTERIEETGHRLADYAQSFNVPFEYHCISSKWENIQVEDLKIDKGEVLVVNCMFKFQSVVDETVVADSPRNKVLNMIRKMNPDVFIHGIVNGSYSAPFFVTRFREALFHFSTLFDMLETNVPREDDQRLLIERDLFGKEVMNVISCEGSERVERPETYKQWHVRNLRAGFTQLPLDPAITKKARDKVKSNYHKDFIISEDNRWLLQGWKGRILYAISTWRPTELH